MYLPLPGITGKTIEKAALGLGAGEVRLLLRQQIIGAVATAIAVVALSGLASLSAYDDVTRVALLAP
jgi:hypothetical protein